MPMHLTVYMKLTNTFKDTSYKNKLEEIENPKVLITLKFFN